MCEISVVVPVYNTENTVEACVSSILTQTFTDFELLLINDGSKDSSDAVCRKLADGDSRIRYIKKENGGLSSVRNLGMKEATGKYIYFIDSDDFIDSDCLQFLYEKAEETFADIVLCGYLMENGKTVSRISVREGLYDSSTINEQIVELKSKNLIDPAWNKLYKLDFLRSSGVKMPVGDYYEDTYFNLNLLRYNPVIAVTDKCFYHYILHMGSITRRYNPEKIKTIKERARLLKKVTKGVEKYCDFFFVKYVFSSVIDMFMCCKRDEIINKIKLETGTEEFKSAANNAFMPGRLNEIIIKTARSGNYNKVYRFCFLSYILKYKMQRLFMKVRGL